MNKIRKTVAAMAIVAGGAVGAGLGASAASASIFGGFGPSVHGHNGCTTIWETVGVYGVQYVPITICFGTEAD
jgi:hypothetical protein